MARVFNTDVIRHMSRDELEEELVKRDVDFDEEDPDDRLRDYFCSALVREGEKDDI